ncbi:MAG TPA: ATP-dependent sacrificial sulfur transferase LarE [Gemmatimonadaceae bacterium]|nr:ATP-dependent sacrificial sulfur transferase LarE [Gemmatimonadaceae bacterium]
MRSATITSGESERADPRAAAKEAALAAWLRARGSVAIGFSGGVDSTYLACIAVRTLGPEHVLAVIGRSASYPAVQWEHAREVAERFGVPVLEVDTDELHDPRYAANPTDRCYFCKTELWQRVRPVAAAQGMAIVVDGTNADDLGGHRPGARAAGEQGVASPLAELGFTKAEIRARSRALGIPTWDQPASPCLASRLPYGTPVTPERLRRVERAEASLRALGIGGDLRVRDHGELARVELAPDELPRWLAGEGAHRLRTALRDAGYARAAVDLRGFRSGSLNVLDGVVPA